MLIYDTLDKLAEGSIPSGIHSVLHVNSQQAWVETVVSMYKKGVINNKQPKVVKFLLDNWEELLYKKYSELN